MTENTRDIIKIKYCPHLGQRQVHKDDSRFRIVVCGRRWGKTTLAVNECIKYAFKKRKAVVFFIAPTYRQAEMIAWDMLVDLLPTKLISRKNLVKLEVELINGSVISLKGADNEDSLRGVGLDFVVMDEYSSMKVNVWSEIVRPMLSDRLGKALFIGTPKGKNHFWELYNRGLKKDGIYSSFSFKSEDNPIIPRSEIKDAKDQLNERYFNQEYEASFEDYTGLIWPEFRHADHVIDPIQVPNWYERFGVIDPALSGTTAVLKCAVDEAGVLYITDEFYDQNKRVSEVAEVIRDWKISRWYIDPAGKIKNYNRDGQLFNFIDEYREQAGISPIPGENDVDAGINRVAEFFKQNKIKIFKNCKNLIRELELYHWAEERETILGVSTPKPFKNNDHACDCLRYAVMSRYSESMKPKPRSKDPAMPLAIELLQDDEGKSDYQRLMA